jgi:hypothetical protein
VKILFNDYDLSDVSLERDIFRQAGIEMLEAQCPARSRKLSTPRVIVVRCWYCTPR